MTTTTAPKVSPVEKAERNVLTSELAHALGQAAALDVPDDATVRPQGHHPRPERLDAQHRRRPSSPVTRCGSSSDSSSASFSASSPPGCSTAWIDGCAPPSGPRRSSGCRSSPRSRSGRTPISAIPVVDIVVDPYSPISEAYRKLYVAILTAPAVTWVKRGGSGLEPAELAPARPLVSAPAGGGAAMAGSPDHGPVAEGRYPTPVGTTELVTPRRHRFAILITSPNDEPSRSLAVVNLATVFAEAGDRVLVATTGGMRTEFEGNGKGFHGWEGEIPDTDAAELVANARPSQIPGVSSLALGSLFSNPARLALKGRKFDRGGPRRRRRASHRSTPPFDTGWSCAPAGRRPCGRCVRELAYHRAGRTPDPKAVHTTSAAGAGTGHDEHAEGSAGQTRRLIAHC